MGLICKVGIIMRKLILLLIFTNLVFMGCTATTRAYFTDQGAVVIHGSQEALKYTDGNKTVEFDSRRDSLIRTIAEFSALKEVNKQ